MESEERRWKERRRIRSGRERERRGLEEKMVARRERGT